MISRIKGWLKGRFIVEMKCETCEHWPDDYQPWGGFKPCQSDGGRNMFKIDGGDGTDGLYTKPDFYCSLWEPK